MALVALLGRVLFSYMFVASGINHFKNRKHMGEYAGSMGVPAASLAVVGSGAVIIAGAVMVILGLVPDLGALLLAAFLIPTAFLMHPFWKIEDPQMRQMQQINFNKNLAMAGGALALFVLFSTCAPGLTLTGPLF
jgi:uncharacterized membrane protein YphA (DoxX/SURF4 family)